MRDMGFIAKFKSAIILMAGAVGIAGTAGAVGFSALSEGGAGQKQEKTDAEGHVLVKLWKAVDKAVGEDRPQTALSSLEKVMSEAKSRHLAWDYCDAWIQYRTIAVRRDWKQNDPLSRRMAEEALEFGDPLVAYCLNYSQISDVDSVLRFAEAQAPVLKASRSAAFYSRESAQKMSLYGYSSLPDFVISGMSNDYEYVMWSLLSGLGYGSDDWNRVRSILAEYLGDAYPSGAYLELLGVRHFDYDRAAKAPEAGGADAAALKKKRLVGPSASGVTSKPSVVIRRGILSVQGTTLPKNSNVRRTHISRPAQTQNTGNIPRVTRPARIPARISSSLKAPSSKNFSISTSSCSAAASTNA